MNTHAKPGTEIYRDTHIRATLHLSTIFFFFFIGALQVPLIAYWSTWHKDVSVGVRLVSGETLLQEKVSTGHRYVILYMMSLSKFIK